MRNRQIDGQKEREQKRLEAGREISSLPLQSLFVTPAQGMGPRLDVPFNGWFFLFFFVFFVFFVLVVSPPATAVTVVTKYQSEAESSTSSVAPHQRPPAPPPRRGATRGQRLNLPAFKHSRNQERILVVSKLGPIAGSCLKLPISSSTAVASAKSPQSNVSPCR